MERIIKTSYNGCVALRDFDVEKCIKTNENMKVVYSGDTMMLSPEDLQKKLVRVSDLQKNKIPGGRDYKLYYYQWEPQEIEL